MIQRGDEKAAEAGAVRNRTHPDRRGRTPRWHWSTGAALAMVLLSGSVARTQDVTEPSLKAAYVYNFARFTEWRTEALPASATGALTACVLNDNPVSDALLRTVRGRLLSGRGINVLSVQPDGPLRSCHLLYISAASPAQVASIVKTVSGSPVLTISEFDSFARKGGMVHMFVRNGKIHFNIDLGLARRSGLQLSSKLLSLADEVYDDAAGGQR